MAENKNSILLIEVMFNKAALFRIDVLVKRRLFLKQILVYSLLKCSETIDRYLHDIICDHIKMFL